MKKNNNISRRDFLLINYIKEAITRRDFLKGMFGGLAATQIPDIAMASDEDNESDEADKEILNDFILQCFSHLRKYQSSHKLEYILLKTILKNSIFTIPEDKDFIRIRRVVRSEKNVFGRDFYGERDRLEIKLKKIRKKLDLDFVEPATNPFVLDISISPKLFISRFINVISNFLRRKEYSEEEKIFEVAFQGQEFNESNEYYNLFKKGVKQ